MKKGFRWCPHCRAPHGLEERMCPRTGRLLDHGIHVARDAPLVGAILDGKYRVLDLIGEGGMGQVFDAEHIALRRLVAIKVVARKAGEQALLRLEREAQIVAAIHHPNICQVYDVVRLENGQPCIVFERLIGETLAKKLRRRGRLSIRRSIQIFSEALSGLQAAHERSIVHRDLKPQNVFLVERAGFAPLVKIVDFGVALDASSQMMRITRPGIRCGTMEYMSPEQLQGAAVDGRSDLFAIGVMLYACLAGRHPFIASDALAMQTKIMNANPRPLRHLRPDAPADLEAIVMSALAPMPWQRPRSALEMQRALLEVHRRRSENAAPPMVSDWSDDAGPISVTQPTGPHWLLPSAGSPEA